MKQRYILVIFCCLVLFVIGAFVYWNGFISTKLFSQKDPFVYGKELLYSGQYLESEIQLKKALENDPANVRVFGVLGMLYYRQGDTKLAYKYWSDALKIDPDEPTIKGLVKALENEKFQHALLYHMEIKTVNHAQPWEQYFTNGQNLYLKGDYPQSIEELKKAGSLRPDDSQIHFVLGAAYLKLDHKDRTLQEWERALSLNPEDRMIRELLDKLKNRYKNNAR